jgi:hypothetical protein
VFSTFLVFLLLYAHPEQAAGRFWERNAETLLVVGVAFVFGLPVPLIRQRRRRSPAAAGEGAEVS